MDRFDRFDTFILGIFISTFGSIIYLAATGIPKDAKTYRQLAKPCLEQGYTKAKCRKMIYIPQSEEAK